MTTTPTTLTYTLEEVLSRFEQKMDRQFIEINQKMDRQFAEINQKMDRQFAEVNQKLEKIDDRLNKLEIGQAALSGETKALDERLTGQIKTLDEKVSGIDKRLDNQEFINRGILVAVVIALLSGAAKLFDILPK
jgi:predicted nuclease with TOPRIM domain